jgi:hypothetical protein
MPIEDFIISVFCEIEVLLKEVTRGRRLRQRGFPPRLSDSEVLTMEVVGEYLGIDTDKGIWAYFCHHWRGWFPGLGSRANFAKQAASLWRMKQRIQTRLAARLGAFADPIHVVDGFPVPVCLFQRANSCKRFQGEASYGYCASKDQTYYGFHGHLLISFSGVICDLSLTGASVDEREALWELIGTIYGLLIGDKGYIDKRLKEELAAKGIHLETPLRANMKDSRDPRFVRLLTSTRRLIETVIGQLAERLHIEKVWARDLWHLTSRVARKILAHTFGIFLNRQLGREPLQFDGLIQV